MNKTQLFAKLKKELNITKFIPIAGLSMITTCLIINMY